jgi:RNA polymerase sigma-70 factor, ECF subfamily
LPAPDPRPSPRAASPDETPPSGANDSRLVERIRHGDVAAFEELYRRYWVRLYEFCFRYVRSTDDAADVVQEVFFRIWRGRETWRVVGRLDAYLHSAVRNGAYDRLQHAALVHRWRQGAQADAEGLARAAASAEEAIQAGEVGAAVERALAELPEKRRAICMLRWVEGLTYAEIAARLGIAEKTVETQIARGLRFLRERAAELRP